MSETTETAVVAQPSPAVETAPAQALDADAGTDEGDDEDDDPDGVLKIFEELTTEIQIRQDVVNGPNFNRLMQQGYAKVTRDEMGSYLYGFLLKMMKLNTGLADAMENLYEKLEDLEDENERQGTLLRSMVSGSILTVAVQLCQLVASRPTVDDEMRQIAQAILAAVQQAPQVVQHAQAVSAPTEGSPVVVSGASEA